MGCTVISTRELVFPFYTLNLKYYLPQKWVYCTKQAHKPRDSIIFPSTGVCNFGEHEMRIIFFSHTSKYNDDGYECYNVNDTYRDL